MFENCIGNCGGGFGPPPDMILSMPPPPLPSFLLPKAVVPTLPTNDSQPCFATFMCDPNPNPRESGIEFVELTGVDSKGENTWLFILISSCVGVLILGGLLAVILLKCRETLFSSCNLSYHDSNLKQGNLNNMGDNSKANSFMAGGILYPCTAVNTSRDTLQSQLANDNRLLWATLTPHGTRHFISDYPMAPAPEPVGTLKSTGTPHQDSGHYEVVDYRSKTNQIYRDYVKKTPIKSFDNSGFIDYDYEDPTPLMESYHDDLDSGYQEPHEVMGGSTMHRISPRPVVSSPTRIDNPNIPPLNYYPTHRSQLGGLPNAPAPNAMPSNATTLNRKTTLSRRISDASAYGNPQM